jgi:hypothetical protein
MLMVLNHVFFKAQIVGETKGQMSGQGIMDSPGRMDNTLGKEESITGIQRESMTVHGIHLQVVVGGTRVELGLDFVAQEMTLLAYEPLLGSIQL